MCIHLIALNKFFDALIADAVENSVEMLRTRKFAGRTRCFADRIIYSNFAKRDNTDDN
jgi:hypothetical protein